MRPRTFWQRLMDGCSRLDTATLDSEGNQVPSRGVFAWLISGVALGCGCVAVGIVVAFSSWYVAGQDAVWQASVGAILVLLGIWQIEGGIRKTAVHIRDKKLRRRHRL